MTQESLRIGTWNILSFDDEYNLEYGCPLSIAWCPNRNETIGSTTNCTQQRYERIWNVLEEQAVNYDIVCLQEVSDDFLAIQQQQQQPEPSSNWTVVQRNQECAVLQSNASPWQIVSSFNVTNVPNLSGCRDLPMVVLQSPQQQQSNSTVSYLVGSVHVQASVPNMSVWYQTTIDAILNTTNYHQGEERMTVEGGTDWMQHPVLMIVGGDFNHNLTTANNINATTTTTITESPPEPWTLVAPTDILVQGTTQKEYNYMGMYDGFLVSSTSLLLQQPANVTNNTNITDLWSFNATNVSVYMKGFMPKVVYGFPQQENRTIQTTAQFALISTTNDNRTFWNATMVVPEYMNDTLSDWQLLFSPSSNFTSTNDAIIVPYSHPIHEALSDHLFVSATFAAALDHDDTTIHNNSSSTTPTNNTNNNNSNNSTSNGNDTMDTSKSNTFLSQLTPFGRTCVYLGLALMVLAVVLRCCCCRGRRRNAMVQDLDRVSLTNNHTPPQIQ